MGGNASKSGVHVTWEELREDQKLFATLYSIRDDDFARSGLLWGDLIEIGDDYDAKRTGFENLARNIESELESIPQVHFIRWRLKDTGGLLEKVIRKSRERDRITVEDYQLRITDLIGVRLLHLFKEEYLPIHEEIIKHYQNRLVQNIELKYCKGDDLGVYKGLERSAVASMIKPVENDQYRSIHYTIRAEPDNDNSPRAEIQVRTLFEEGWGEINHRLVYKQDGTPLDRTLMTSSNILSKLVGICDSVGGMMERAYSESLQRQNSVPGRHSSEIPSKNNRWDSAEGPTQFKKQSCDALQEGEPGSDHFMDECEDMLEVLPIEVLQDILRSSF